MAESAPPRRGAYTAPIIAALVMAALVYLINSQLPWPTPGGAYAVLGFGMLLPLLALGVVLSWLAAAVVVAVAGVVSGLGAWRAVLIGAATGLLSAAAFIHSFNSLQRPTQRILEDVETHGLGYARYAELSDILGKRKQALEPAFLAMDLAPLRDALAERDPDLTPARLLCMTAQRRGEPNRPSLDAASFQRYFEQAADLAWEATEDAAQRRAIGMLAVDGALRRGSAENLSHWLARGVRLNGVYWRRDVEDIVVPAGPCGSMKEWPLDVLAHATYDDRQEKFALLLAHGMAVPPERQAEVFAWFPLSEPVIDALAAQGVDPARPARWDGEATAPLTVAIGMMNATFPGQPFKFDDDEILAYVRALLAAGAKSGDAGPDGLDARQALAQAETSLRERQDNMQMQRREAQAVLNEVEPARRPELERRMGLHDEKIDLARTALVRQVREALDAADGREDA